MDEEIKMVSTWLDWNPARMCGGWMSGLLGGVLVALLGMLFATASGLEIWYPVKVMALIWLGPHALDIGLHWGAIICGFAFLEVLCGFLGAMYAQFVKTEKFLSLFLMGMVWGFWSWVFLFCLFGQAFDVLYRADLSFGAAFLLCLAYGISLVSVPFFEGRCHFLG